MSLSLVESSTIGAHFIEFQELQPLHCSKDALTDFFGWLLQGLLAGIAFSCLIGELAWLSLISLWRVYFNHQILQPVFYYSQKILWAKLSTKTMGYLVVWYFKARDWSDGHSHDKRLSFTFVQRRSMYMVSWIKQEHHRSIASLILFVLRYIINFLLDSTIGLFIIYIGIRICIFVAKVKHWDAINFGEYSELTFKLSLYCLWLKFISCRCIKVMDLSDVDLCFLDGHS